MDYLLSKKIGIVGLLIFFFSSSIGLKKARAQQLWTKEYDNAAVVTVNKIASNVGKRILKEGGNAIDATVSVQFALAVTHPRNGNIGGGGFMVVHLKDGTNKALDFREKAPHEATTDMYIRHGKYISSLSRDSVISSGVPGVVDGMVRAEKKYGNLSLKKVMAPAIQLAEKGYKLTWLQAKELNENGTYFKEYDSSTKYFTKANGEPYHEGDLFVQKDLAKTLQRISKNGRAGFYDGKTADMIVKEEKKLGGIIDHQDLNDYKSVWRDPVNVSFRGYNLHVMSSPSSGGVAIAQMLDMIRPYNLKEMGFNSAKYIHLLTEAMRRAFADRNYFMGDPAFVNIPRDTLLSKSYNRDRMGNFSWDHATRSKDVSHGKIRNYHGQDTQTTSYSIVDGSGNAVAVTTTLNSSYGNHISIAGAGFLMNNEMDDFTSEPGKPNQFGLVQGKANEIKPEKRMLSSMSPTVVTRDGKVSMVLGAAGGPMIINTVLETFLDRAIFDMNAKDAISVPRFHNQWLPDNLFYEKNGLSADTKGKLKSLGHHLKMLTKYNIGLGQIIFITQNGKRQGAADPRGDGITEGY